MTLRLREAAAVIHVDTALKRYQFASAHQSGDVEVGAAGGQDLAARDNSVLHQGDGLDMPEIPARHTPKREGGTAWRPA